MLKQLFEKSHVLEGVSTFQEDEVSILIYAPKSFCKSLSEYLSYWQFLKSSLKMQ